MILKTKAVDTISEREDLIAMLTRNLKDVPHALRFHWLYVDAPAGKASSWFVCDENGRAVGVASVFPKYVWINGILTICGQVGDFGVDPEFRSLGPALLLQRATFEPVLRREMAFCYDCPPHESGMATFYRLGLHENCRMRHYVRPLRTERYLERIVGKRAARSGGRLGNAFLKLRRAGRPTTGIELQPQTGDFGGEFSALDKSVPSANTIRVRRNAQDLTWRYCRNPLAQFEVLTARRSGEVIAYVVFHANEEDGHIVDLFGWELEVSGPVLLEAVADELRRRGVQALRALVAGTGPLGSIFQEAGFVYREPGARIVAFSSPDGILTPVLERYPQWNFQYCDVTA